MNEATPNIAQTTLRPRGRRAEQMTIAAVVLVIVACLLALWQRDRVRAWWWTRGLVKSQSTAEQRYYLTMLAGVHGASVAAVAPLLHDPDPAIRSLAVAVLVHGQTPAAREALIGALSDTDQDVRDDAAHALAFAYGPQTVADLRSRIWNARGAMALAMCVAMGRAEDESATLALLEIARHHADANVRAQAVERLGYRGSSTVESELRVLLDDPAPVTARLYDERMNERANQFA